MNLYAIATALQGALSYRKLRYYLSRGYYRPEAAEEYAGAVTLGIDPARAGEISERAASEGAYESEVRLGNRRYTLALTIEGE
jgi:hypothetical protein